MSAKPPGPLCVSRVGQDWIDPGTSCLSRSSMPGPLGKSVPVAPDPFQAIYDAEHVYSTAPEALIKRKIDLSYIGGDYRRGNEIRIDNKVYLKRLIASGRKLPGNRSPRDKKVPQHTYGLEFFIIRGGAEGFLPSELRGKDARNVPENYENAAIERFDHNDLLVVFDSAGHHVSSARLERPIFIDDKVNKSYWSEKTANEVYDKWPNKDVFIYKNTSYTDPYLGLGVEDGFRGRHTVDMHRKKATEGCIYIVDPKTPAREDPNIRNFVPQLITDILNRVGLRASAVGASHITLGIMQVIELL